MKREMQITYPHLASLLAGLVVCLSPAFSSADGADNATPRLFGNTQQPLTNQPLHLLPLQREQTTAGLAFDLGGSDTHKLELRLNQPLTLSINNGVQKSSSGIGSVFLDSSLSMNLNEYLDITTSLGAGKSQTSFKPLGSIHCQNGVLEQGSYRASDCYFINQANVLKQDQVAFGLRFANDNLKTAVSMFRRETTMGQSGVINYALPITHPVLGAGLLTPQQANPFLPTFYAGQPLNYLNSEATGLDMEFQLGLTMNSAGDVKLGLQLTRVLDATFEAGSVYTPGLQNWTIANPFDSAKVNLDWSKGNFSGGIQAFYREQVQFLNRADLNSATTFDVHFTWRAPWNANLSVGTTNLLNAGREDTSKTDNSLQDPFESIYGRIPYVRYQQDL